MSSPLAFPTPFTLICSHSSKFCIPCFPIGSHIPTYPPWHSLLVPTLCTTPVPSVHWALVLFSSPSYPYLNLDSPFLLVFWPWTVSLCGFNKPHGNSTQETLPAFHLLGAIHGYVRGLSGCLPACLNAFNRGCFQAGSGDSPPCRAPAV